MFLWSSRPYSAFKISSMRVSKASIQFPCLFQNWAYTFISLLQKFLVIYEWRLTMILQSKNNFLNAHSGFGILALYTHQDWMHVRYQCRVKASWFTALIWLGTCALRRTALIVLVEWVWLPSLHTHTFSVRIFLCGGLS